MITHILYAALGLALAAAGVSIVEQPLYFCLILAIVIGIDLTR